MCVYIYIYIYTYIYIYIYIYITLGFRSREPRGPRIGLPGRLGCAAYCFLGMGQEGG